MVQDARDYFNGLFPDGVYPGTSHGVIAVEDVFAVVPMDKIDFGPCGTPNYQVWPPPEHPEWGSYFSNGMASDYIWSFVNDVALQVKESHPNKLISAAAYANYTYPPSQSIDISDNIAVMLCKGLANYWDQTLMDYSHHVIDQWRARVGKLYVWEYYNFPQFLKRDKFPGIMTKRIANELKYLKNTGVEGFFIELDSDVGSWANPVMDGHNMYITLRMIDRPELNLDDILSEYYTLFYGPAASPMRRFFEKLEEVYTDPQNWQGHKLGTSLDSDRSWNVMGNAKVMRYLYNKLKYALALTEATHYHERVKLVKGRIYDQMDKSRIEKKLLAPVSRYGENRVANADFEDGTDLWESNGDMWSGTEGSSESGSIHLRAGGIISQDIPVEPSTKYQIRFARKTINEGFIITVYWSNDQLVIGTSEIFCPDTDDWAVFNTSVCAPDGAENAKLRFFSGSLGDVFIDDVSFRMIPQPLVINGGFDPDINLVINPSFDSDVSSWHTYKSQWIDDDGNSSNGCVELASAGDYMGQNIQVSPDASYLFTFYYRCIPSPSEYNLYPFYVWYDSKDQQIRWHSIFSGFANDWTQKSQIIKAPENASSVRLQFPGRHNTIGRFDDISLSETPPGVYKIYKPGTADWRLGRPNAEWVSDDGHSSPGSIRSTTGPIWGWLLQYIEVDSMTDYILSYSIRCPRVDLRWNHYPIYIFYDEDSNQVDSFVSMKSTCTDTEWTRFTQRIYVPKNATFLGIQLNDHYSDDPSYIGALYDDISLHKDSDGDDIYDDADNCPHVSNPQQINTDKDELGDACDPDDDNDGLPDIFEQEKTQTNPLIKDSDGDGIHDGDEDPDDDGFTNLEEYEGESDPLHFCSIPKGETLEIQLDIPAGWSMISLPVKPDSLLASDVFPNAKVIYGFEKDTGYIRIRRDERLEIGRGYWVLFYEEQTLTLIGQPVCEYTLPVDQNGWYMIGGCSYSSQASIDNGSIVLIYSYIPGIGYQRLLESEKLKTGKGYWILLLDIIDKAELRIEAIGSY